MLRVLVFRRTFSINLFAPFVQYNFTRQNKTLSSKSKRFVPFRRSTRPSLQTYKKLREKDTKKQQSQSVSIGQKQQRCDGCNSILQSQDKTKFGFIDKKVIQSHFGENAQALKEAYAARMTTNEQKIRKIIYEVEDELGVEIMEKGTREMKKIEDVQTLLRLQDKMDAFEEEEQVLRRLKERRKDILCYRCYTLKFHNRLPEEYDTIAPVGGSMRTVLDKVFAKHQRAPIHYLYIVDVLDMCGTFIQQVYLKLVQQKASFAIVINKLDILNEKYLRKQMLPVHIRSMIKQFDTRNFIRSEQKVAIFLVSSTCKVGLKNLSEYLKERNRIQLLGVANVGKTSLLNALGRINKPTSRVAGTTIHITSHRVGRKTIYDMPGMQWEHSLSSLVAKANERALLTWSKMHSPPLLTHSAFFYGGKVEAEGLRIIPFGLAGTCSSDSRWFVLNRALFWKGLPPPHLLSIVRHDLTIHFVDGVGQDVQIAGYGFIGFRLCEKKAPDCFRNIRLYLPSIVQFRLRQSLIRDSELLHLRSSLQKRHQLDRILKAKTQKNQ